MISKNEHKIKQIMDSEKTFFQSFNCWYVFKIIVVSSALNIQNIVQGLPGLLGVGIPCGVIDGQSSTGLGIYQIWRNAVFPC